MQEMDRRNFLGKAGAAAGLGALYLPRPSPAAAGATDTCPVDEGPRPRRRDPARPDAGPAPGLVVVKGTDPR